MTSRNNLARRLVSIEPLKGITSLYVMEPGLGKGLKCGFI